MPNSLLFTGHMIDKPDRPTPRFPPTLEEAARTRIAQAVIPYAPSQTGSDEPVRGFASGARGGDILFHEQCRAHGIATTVILPFPPEVFVRRSVEGLPGSDWEQRFWSLWDTSPITMREVMDLPVSNDAYAACNTRLMVRAREYGNVHLIAMWDGESGDGPGGTADLIDQAALTNKPDIFSPASLRTDA